jgi:hypothetical protein
MKRRIFTERDQRGFFSRFVQRLEMKSGGRFPQPPSDVMD